MRTRASPPTQRRRSILDKLHHQAFTLGAYTSVAHSEQRQSSIQAFSRLKRQKHNGPYRLDLLEFLPCARPRLSSRRTALAVKARAAIDTHGRGEWKKGSWKLPNGRGQIDRPLRESTEVAYSLAHECPRR